MAKALILKELIKLLDINISKFERNIEVGVSTISHAIRRNADISTEVALKIKKRYPQVDMAWLQTGEGDMLLPDKSQVNKSAETNNPELKSESLTKVKTDEGHEDKSGDNQHDILSSLSTKGNTPMNDLIKLALLQQASIEKLIAHAAALEQKIPPATIVSVNRGKAQVVKEK